ncbi:MAG: hypothetical protein H0X29_09500 [Parachlamydiaceae bacterium]|nr:hypothetical protein [Parachlamydiaceae bacterium]
MKVLTLLERYGIATNPEARNIVKNSPIITVLESETSKCTLTQKLFLFPEQSIVVMGSSELDLKTQTIQKLFPETFYISLESTQTGFPHPSQRAGWALANQLLPESPQRPDLLDSLSHFFERKKLTMTGLLPHGKLLAKAKNLLRIKKHLFEINKNELIELHRNYFLTLLEIAPSPLNRGEIRSSIIEFYDMLHRHSTPFDVLVDAHQQMRDLFITRPHNALLEAIIAEPSQAFQKKYQGMKYEIANDFLQKALDSSHREIISCDKLYLARAQIEHLVPARGIEIQWKYIDSLGTLLGTSTNRIILQYFSEDLLYVPPTLNVFEQKIQSAAYRQVKEFMEELHAELSVNKDENYQLIYSQIKAGLLNEIDILNSNDQLPVSTELASYFQLRHQSL